MLYRPQYHDLDDGMRPISVIFPYLPTEFHRRRDAAREALRNIFAKARDRCPLKDPCLGTAGAARM